MADAYLFKSNRLGFRNWKSSDIHKMQRISADPIVMAYFPSTKSKVETIDFIHRMQAEYNETGFCYFAVDLLEANEFIGFIGISRQDFEAEFTPCIDIGWRLGRSHWNKGFATEGAKRCLDYAFNVLSVDQILSICPKININSERVMQKIGMNKKAEFLHPLLMDHKSLAPCCLYEITRAEYRRL